MNNTRGSSLDLLPEGRRQVLTTLKEAGTLAAEKIAKTLGISVSGARQHLAALARQGFVEYDRLRHGPGRPRHLYRVSRDGDALFTRRYGELATELLAYVQAGNPQELQRVFLERQRRRVRDGLDRLEGLEGAERVQELARILDQDGYFAHAEVLEDGAIRLVERNCAVRDVAERFHEACSTEIEFLTDLLPGAQILRDSHIVDGAAACTYLIRFRHEDTTSDTAPKER
ncbi:MAG: helix-turn-helix domain-containing protein [Gemmatimonadetes bacterium]|nr:helix-turn-helix domain-containing protein [Gemmatimonadota bacterium]